ncbi:hypothetical protein [Streptomyces sp. NPDC059597]|uniref:hypothetical protein n=1 Tax=Streptomyces sp. NPDC059597 TaxID=3346879 RepID=UPI003675A3B5
MICHRCGELIKGKPEVVSVETGSAVSADIYVCPTPCKPPLHRQTAPTRHARW